MILAFLISKAFLFAMFVAGSIALPFKQIVSRSRLATCSLSSGSAAATTFSGGLCALYKPRGCTSASVVEKIKYIFNPKHSKLPKIKVGHGGTLDPMAEGVLVIGLGEGTRLLTNYLSGSKGYKAVALLGTETDTLDITGKVMSTIDSSSVTHDTLRNVLPKFTGDIMQMPPMYSALRSNGQRMYDLARKGITVDREARPVTVYGLKLLEGRTLPEFELDIECSGGFYVRSVIADICIDIGSVGCMTELVRTKQAMFTIDQCLREADWNYDNIVVHTAKCNAIAGVLISNQNN